ncbi:MAG: hypothetical protein ABI865_09145 [Nitrosospira sp.]
MSFLLGVNLTPVRPFAHPHQNWIKLASMDAPLSNGTSYYHQGVLDTDGILYLASWRHMEPSEGVYDFANLLQSLNYAASHGKKIIIRVFYKNYYGSTKPLPSYITNNPTTYGGTGTTGGLRINTFGATCYTPRFDNAALTVRFKALITAMAAAVGSHSALQGVSPDESAWSLGGLWNAYAAEGLTAAQVRLSHREKCLHFQSCFPTKEVYPFYNYCDGSNTAETIAELNWSLGQGMLAGISDTHRLPEMISGIQPVITAYPMPVKTLQCVDLLSYGADDSGLTERMLKNARETARYGADITCWHAEGGVSSNFWAAAKNAMALIG